MEIKEMKNLLFIRKWHYFASIVLMLLVVSSCFGDITQYKRIGETDYYLVETEDGIYTDIYYYIDEESGFGESVKYKGFVKEIYWNDKYLIVKCTNRESQKIINYCIIEQYGRNDKYIPWKVHEYATKQEFEKAKIKFGLDEKKMNYTDSYIPWSLHLFD